MTVSLLRTIVSGERVVEFEGRSLDQAQQSDDATETVTAEFHAQPARLPARPRLDQGGADRDYRRGEDLCRAAGSQAPGARGGERAARWRRSSSRVTRSSRPRRAGQQDGDGAPLLNLAVLEKQPPKFCDYAVPNEEFRCAPDARDLDSSIYLAHVPPKTISDLADDGLRRRTTSMLESGSTSTTNLIASARDGNRDTDADRSGANRRVAYREEHVLYDLNGDGIAERLMVQRVGNHVLALEEEDDHPFEEWCPFPMPHRRIGQSLAEKVMDIQRTRSVVLRQTMDGFYFANAPRTFVNEDSWARARSRIC
jgi:hypothetical protein